MAKKSDKGGKLGKNQKLDLILAEIANLRAEVRLLGKQQAPLSDRAGKRPAAKGSSKPTKGKVPAPAAKASSRKPHAAPKRPVLVAAAETATVPQRTAAQS